MSISRTFLLVVALAVPAPACSQDVTVFAAASLKDALDAAAAAWERETAGDATISYAGSSALARQIEAGAPADLFISANEAWMDELEAQDLIVADSRTDLFSNTLVLIAPAGAPQVRLIELPTALGDGRLALALYDAVPAGIYGRLALESLGLWDAIVDRVAQADNVRAALSLVAAAEAPFGIVYATDAAAEPRVQVAAVFPPETHPDIVYPAAVVAGGDEAAAGALLDFLQRDEARQIFRDHGFMLR